MRYYLEKSNRKVKEIVFQTDEGIFTYDMKSKEEYQTYPDQEISVVEPKSYEWIVFKTASKEFFEFYREHERNKFWETQPTEIKEIEGNKEVILQRIISNL